MCVLEKLSIAWFITWSIGVILMVIGGVLSILPIQITATIVLSASLIENILMIIAHAKGW